MPFGTLNLSDLRSRAEAASERAREGAERVQETGRRARQDIRRGQERLSGAEERARETVGEVEETFQEGIEREREARRLVGERFAQAEEAATGLETEAQGRLEAGLEGVESLGIGADPMAEQANTTDQRANETAETAVAFLAAGGVFAPGGPPGYVAVDADRDGQLERGELLPLGGEQTRREAREPRDRGAQLPGFGPMDADGPERGPSVVGADQTLETMFGPPMRRE